MLKIDIVKKATSDETYEKQLKTVEFVWKTNLKI
jgi:hypothetical protein